MNATSKTDEVMPMVIALINRDIMPLIARVLSKHAELYLREIEELLEKGTPDKTPSTSDDGIHS